MQFVDQVIVWKTGMSAPDRWWVQGIADTGGWMGMALTKEQAASAGVDVDLMVGLPPRLVEIEENIAALNAELVDSKPEIVVAKNRK